jgi:NAD(P)-dependent dehydrogenase (short-subunit alcohol dehydrogenase family)
MMDDNFKGQVALVTGAAVGMGFATAKAFAEAGAAVALVDVNQGAAERAADQLGPVRSQGTGDPLERRRGGDVAAMVGRTVATFGRLDAAFNNAGIQSPAVEIADVSVKEFDRVNAINLRGVWMCMKYELRHMRTQGRGAIVNNSLIGRLIGLPGRAAYHASKHGVLGMTKSVALEYASRGIRIYAVCRYSDGRRNAGEGAGGDERDFAGPTDRPPRTA